MTHAYVFDFFCLNLRKLELLKNILFYKQYGEPEVFVG